MKYSVRGTLDKEKEDDIITLLNTYTLWKLVPDTHNSKTDPIETFVFEAWVNTEEDKDLLFDNLKSYIIHPHEHMDWHECTHDEDEPQSCVIAEEYRRD